MDTDQLTREELVARCLELEAANRRLAEATRADRRAGALVKELQIHQGEQEAQNQALRDAQQQLEESRDRYADLYDFAPAAYLTLDRSGIIRDLNLTAAALLGRDRSHLFDQSLAAVGRVGDASDLLAHLAGCFDDLA